MKLLDLMEITHKAVLGEDKRCAMITLDVENGFIFVR